MQWKYLIASLYWREVLSSLDEFHFYKGLKDQTQTHLINCAQSKRLYQYLKSENSWDSQAKKELEWCASRQIHLTVPGDEDYPFDSLEEPPLLISYLGTPCWKERRCLSVVGSREPGAESLLWMETYLSKLLKTSEWTLVSGGARGVDQKAHAISIQSTQPTLSILPSGLGEFYPPSFQTWLPHILAHGGAVMSSFSPHCQIRKYHFYKRNLLIAGISEVVFIVEARRKSGSLLTAKHALDLGKPICTLPGSPLNQKVLGNLDLLADGAIMIRDDQDLHALHALNTFVSYRESPATMKLNRQLSELPDGQGRIL